jgi:alpha-amylase
MIALGLFVLLAVQAWPTVILQYFESKYSTIEKRMPDIFMAGYDGLWIPPTNRADSGNYSVGYDLYDRFDLGESCNQTLYGTEASLRGMVLSAHTTDIKIYADAVLNHNGFRNKYTTGFEAAGGYPGFALTFPFDSWGDFHDYSASGDLDGQTSGLIDIDQSKNYQYIRHPVAEDTVNNLPYPSISTTNARFYPDPAPLVGDATTFSGFNLTHPLRGVPTKENATGLLLRYIKWMNEVIDVDGFRLDAAKHIPAWFFNNFYDPSLSGKGRPDRSGNSTNPFSFGEVYDGNISYVGSYTNISQNRDALDFPLYFNMYSQLNANGYGDFKSFIYSSVDSYDDGDATNGSMGVQFVEAHDTGLPSPKNNNLAYAYILTRPGKPLIYFNAQEFGTGRSFPRTGRGDALGGQYGDQITKLIDIHNEYAQGSMLERWLDNKYNTSNSRYYVYERDNSLLVGLNLQENTGYDEVVVQTSFPAGTILTELTGNATDTIYNQGGTLFAKVTVNSSQQATLRLPRSNLMRGYVMYGIQNPQGTLSVSSIKGYIGAESTTVWVGTRKITAVPVISSATVTLTLQTDSTEDNAMWKLDDGYYDHTGTLLKSGNFQGFQQVTSGSGIIAAKSVGTTGGLGRYIINIPADSLPEGYHYFTMVAFKPRPSGSPACFNTFKQVFYVDRKGPVVVLTAPTFSGSSDVLSQDFNVQVVCPDLTANSVHIFPDMPAGKTVSDLIPLAADSNHAVFADRSTFTWTWQNISGGTHTLDILAFEASGNASVTRYTNIQATIPSPPLQLGYDSNPSSGSVTFVSIPSQVTTREYGDIVVRVDTQKPGGGSYSYAGGDFYVELQVDTTVYVATTYNASFLPPVNRLVQNDQNLGDNYDEFRLYWKGYATGTHTLTARAHLNPQTQPANSSSAIITIPSTVAGPSITLVSPTTGTVYSDPRNITVKFMVDSTARTVWVFMTDSTGTENLLGRINNPSAGTLLEVTGTLDNPNTSEVEGIKVGNGTYPIRVVSSTSLDGGGITSEKTASITISDWGTTSVELGFFLRYE